jgi:hypothetical protein
MQAERSREESDNKVLPFEVEPPNLAYWGIDSKQLTYHDVKLESFTVDKRISDMALGDEANRAFRTEPIDILLSAIAHSFNRVFSDRTCATVYNEGHVS